MKPLLHPPFIFLFFVFIISINIPTSLCADDSQYMNCNNTFSCGSISNLSYPFWGDNRPDYCGLPNFELKCEENVSKIIINSFTYRILALHLATQNLTVARDEFWSTVCLNDYKNITLDNSLFQYDDGLVDVILYYDCSTPPNPMGQLFTEDCNSDGGTNPNVYYSLQSLDIGFCKSVIIPIFQSQTQVVVANRIQQALDTGFGLKWTGDYDQCDTCMKSGGECGYDKNGEKFNCFCKDGPHTTSCSASGNKSNTAAVGIGIAVGVAALVGVLLGCVYFVVQRRKKVAERSGSKDLFMPPSSGGAATSTTNMSQSVPSYPSSNSDTVQKSFYFGVQLFTFAELEEATKNFHPSRELGDGGFGTVYKGELKDGRVVAVKRHYESNFKRVEQFMNEVEILARIRHKNLVTLYGCTSRHSRELLLVYEFISNGTVADHIHGKHAKSTLIPWPVRLNIAVETAEALAYLHASDVIHRDVKCNNILLDDKFRVKVADFGLSRLFPNDVTHVSTAPQGTPGYVDPEYYQCYQLTDKSDVYSFGVVLVELISSLQAVDVSRHRNDVNLANMAVNKIQNQSLHELVDPSLGFEKDYAIRRMTTAVAELAFRCLQQQRDMRPSMDEVLETLREIKNEEYGAREAEVLDVRTDEIILLKNVPFPVSPNSVADKWVSSSTASNSL